ncbi:MAG: 2Fe-2S iron-sulfur cluster binding domain-containing protein [Planctomycetota bacterium]
MVYVLSIVVFAGLLVGLTALLLVAERHLVAYGVCQIDVNAGERVLEVEGGRPLLASLYDHKLFIPSACGGKGTCGYCKVTVLSDIGPVLPTETPYLTRKEIRAGVRLACQVKVRSDMALRIPEEFLNVRLFSAVVERAGALTHDIRELRFSLLEPGEIRHRPGNYVQVQAPSSEGPVFRAYSISSPVSACHSVDLVVRLVPGGVASTYLHQLNVGDPVTFTGPFGEFRLNEDPAVEVVCVAGGCGMAPVRSILYSIYERWPERRAWLFFGCRTTKDVFYLDDFRRLAEKHPSLHVVYALSDPLGPEERWTGETGFIHLAVEKYLDPGKKRQAFLCGPPPMIEAVTAVLREKGLAPEDIFYDKF